MANNEQLELAEAVRLTLAYGGAEIFSKPQEFLRYLIDMTDNRSYEMRVLLHNCDETLLAPFRQADSMDEHDLRLAACKARDHLVGECQIVEDTARIVALGIAQGIARWREIELKFDEDSWAGEKSKDQTGAEAWGRTGTGGQSEETDQKKRHRFTPWLVALLVCGALAAVRLASVSGWCPWGMDKGVVVVDNGGENDTSTGSDGPVAEEPEERGAWVTTSYETTLPNGYVSEQMIAEYDTQGNMTYRSYEWSEEGGDVDLYESTYGDYDQYGYPAWSKMESKTTEPGGTISDRYESNTHCTYEIDAQGRLLSKEARETHRWWWASSGAWDDGSTYDTETTYTYRGDVVIRSVSTWTSGDSSSTTIREYDENGHLTRDDYHYDGGSGYRTSTLEETTYVYGTGDKLRSSRGSRTETEPDGSTTITTYERAYDDNGFLIKLVETVDGKSTITEYENECDQNGNLVREKNLTDGTVTAYTYRYIEEPSVAVLNGWG